MPRFARASNGLETPGVAAVSGNLEHWSLLFARPSGLGVRSGGLAVRARRCVQRGNRFGWGRVRRAELNDHKPKKPFIPVLSKNS